MGHQINPNLRYLVKSLREGKRGTILEGSSRSGKTFSSVDFIVYLCSKVETGATINIIKETYNSFKTTLYDDFNRRLPDFGIASPFHKQEVKSFKLFGNKINLLGADSESLAHGVSCDYFYVNEMLDVDRAIFDQAEMRCRKFWWGDMNPKYAYHYVFNTLVPRVDVGHLKTTYRDNPFVTVNECSKIESYQTVESSKIAVFYGSKDIDETKKFTAIQKANKYDTEKNTDKFPAADIAELIRCRYNETVGTADPYMWSVYGEGERRAPEGLIFPNVVWVKEFPKNIEKIYWGMDFGYTESPSTLVKVGVLGNDLFAQIKFYQPTPSINELLPLLADHITKDDIVWADPSGENGGRGMISGCRTAGYQVYAANTFPGSIKYGNSVLKKFRLNLIDCPEWRKEQMGYTKARAKVNGVYVTLDEPVDANNHAWDALRISAFSNRL